MHTTPPRVPFTPNDSPVWGLEDSIGAKTDAKKRKMTRRRGACESCRTAKAKCDGAQPCGTCRDERKKRKTCVYSKQARVLANQSRWPKSSTSVASSDNLEIPRTWCSCMQSPSSVRLRDNDSPREIAERPIHRTLLLFQVIDEFIEIRFKRGSGSPSIHHIQELWSEFVKNGMADAPSSEACGALSSDDHSHCGGTSTQTEQVTIQEGVEVWQAGLDTVERLVSAGKLIEAWNLVGRVMREIESFDIKNGPVLRRNEAISERTSAICLKLIDLECDLSFFVGGASHLTSWTNGRFLSLKIKQQKAEDHLFAAKTSLHSEIQAFLQIDVSQEEGLWEFLHVVEEMKHGSRPTELHKISQNTKDDDTADIQELQLMSRLCLMIAHCRTAAASAYYSKSTARLPNPSNDRFNIVHVLRLCSAKKEGEYRQTVIMHARTVLQAFENLCKIDGEKTANNWFRLCGALIAAVVVAIAELGGETSDVESEKDQLTRIEACFEASRTQEGHNPIIEKALEIFGQFGKGSNLPTEESTIGFPEQAIKPLLMQTSELDTASSFGSTGGTIAKRPFLDGTTSIGFDHYHHYRGENFGPPLAIYGQVPYVPYGDDWYWCTRQECSWGRVDTSMMMENTIPMVEPGYLNSQTNVSYQPQMTTLPTDSFGSYSTTVMEAPTDPSLKGYDLWNNNHEGVDGMELESSPNNGLVPYSSGVGWYPGPLGQTELPSHAYGQQYGQVENGGMGNVPLNGSADWNGTWGHRSENEESREWSSAESSFCDAPDASNLRQ